MMWNFQVGGLLAGSTICLYDGNPGFPDLNALWRFVGESRVNFFGAGAAFYASCKKAQVEPAKVADFSALRGIGSTGSPLSPENYQWILDQLGPIWINPISGGTDVVSAFVGGVPTLPVYLGEMQCRCLGAKVEAFDEAGKPLSDEVGELVVTAPMPSMPLRFWNDEGDRRYRDSYFDVYPGIWRHGDWVRITPRGGVIIYGRSDATINRHGIRMGTSELYRAVEDLPEVLDSMVVDLEYLGKESYMPLFVVLRPGESLTAVLTSRIRERIKVALSARHVPNEIFQVNAIPRTLSGKKMELPIKKLLMGQPLEKIANPDTMANPESLAWYGEFARRRQHAAEPQEGGNRG
jgi:acetoacetyl-CoA synthetase